MSFQGKRENGPLNGAKSGAVGSKVRLKRELIHADVVGKAKTGSPLAAAQNQTDTDRILITNFGARLLMARQLDVHFH